MTPDQIKRFEAAAKRLRDGEKRIGKHNSKRPPNRACYPNVDETMAEWVRTESLLDRVRSGARAEIMTIAVEVAGEKT